MKVLLIANNPNVTPLGKDFDLYVHFNHARHWGKVPKEKSIVCNRVTKPVRILGSFRWTYAEAGSKEFYKIPAKDEQVWAVGWKALVESIDSKRKRIPLEGIPYPDGHSPTSGYATIHFFVNQGDEVYLCGFDLKNAPYYNKTKLHRPDFELKEIEKMLESKTIFKQP